MVTKAAPKKNKSVKEAGTDTLITEAALLKMPEDEYMNKQ